MGIFGSSEERTEEKAVDSTGHVNNNIIIREAQDTHQQMISGEKLVIATYLLVFAEILKLIFFFKPLRKATKRSTKIM